MMENQLLAVRKDLYSESSDVSTDLHLKNCDVENSPAGNVEKYEVVFLDLPQFNINEDTPFIISDDDPVKFKTEADGVRTIFIEVPQVPDDVAQDLTYSELTGVTHDCGKVDTPETKHRHSTDGSIAVQSLKSVAENKNCTKNKYLIKNENREEGLYVIKKSEFLVESPTKIATPEKTKTPRARVSKTTSKIKSQPRQDNCSNEDLTWLLNFKLDHILSDSSIPLFRPLDDCQSPEKPASVERDNSDDNVREEWTSTAFSSSTKESSNPLGKKPPFTYTELIECALHEKGPLTVSEIYQWISETFPYYKSWDDKWKNSVRHNLSINPYFRKGTKATQGAGHLWTVSKSAIEKGKGWSWKRQRYQEFEEYTKKLRAANNLLSAAEEAEIAAANIEDKENRQIHRDVLLSTHNQDSLAASMEQAAEDILNGVKRNVEVEFIEAPKVEGNDFLNPVSKDVLMDECGFLSQIELNLTTDTAGNLEITETVGVFDIVDDLGFQYSDMGNHGQQLLPLVN